MSQPPYRTSADQNDRPTMRECPMCQRCPHCKGRRHVRCIACPAVHELDCGYCQVCGLCGGTHLVTEAVRSLWLAENPDPPEAA